MKPEEVKIEKVSEVYVAWSNTDKTEGRGAVIPLAVCRLRSTAIRLGRGQDVHGWDCDISKEIAVRINGRWLAEVYIEYGSTEDEKEEKRLKAREAALAKALKLGLSEEEIKALGD